MAAFETENPIAEEAPAGARLLTDPSPLHQLLSADTVGPPESLARRKESFTL
jgi:hypothetical protein